MMITENSIILQDDIPENAQQNNEPQTTQEQREESPMVEESETVQYEEKQDAIEEEITEQQTIEENIPSVEQETVESIEEETEQQETEEQETEQQENEESTEEITEESTEESTEEPLFVTYEDLEILFTPFAQTYALTSESETLTEKTVYQEEVIQYLNSIKTISLDALAVLICIACATFFNLGINLARTVWDRMRG